MARFDRTLNGMGDSISLGDDVSPNSFVKTDSDSNLISQFNILNQDVSDGELELAKINTLPTRLNALDEGLLLKANIASPTFTGTVSGITQSMVGLTNVNNTSDANKQVSTATQNALNLKANIASPTFTGTVSGITQSMVGLTNVNNTSDVNKPVSTSTQALFDYMGLLKANVASPTFTGTVGGITKSMVGLANVDNTSDANKPVSSSTQMLFNFLGYLKANVASPTFTGTVGGITKSMVGLANVDNTSDANKPVSTATITVITSLLNNMTILSTNLTQKANIASPTFSGTVSGINKAMVGLTNVDNISDANKPVSTATQNALNLKAPNSGDKIISGMTTFTDKVRVKSGIDVQKASSPGTITPLCHVHFQGYQHSINNFTTNFVAWNVTYGADNVNETTYMKFPYNFKVYGISLNVDSDNYTMTYGFTFHTYNNVGYSTSTGAPAGFSVSSSPITGYTYAFSNESERPTIPFNTNFRLKYTVTGSSSTGQSKEFNVLIHGYQYG